MFKILSKNHLPALLALLFLNSMNASLSADECCYPVEHCCYPMEQYCCPAEQCPCASEGKFYVGAFGGQLYSNRTKLIQTGVAFFTEAEGGPLSVDARGRARKNSPGFGGAHIGYEWSPKQMGSWSLTTAAEIEAFFYSNTKRGLVVNPTERLEAHDFVDSFPIHAGVYLLNAVLAVKSDCLSKFVPYVGGGIGLANFHIRNARSLQIDPPEPGVNHFNSRRSDTSWAFAAQAKAGIRFDIWENIRIFGEYRFLYTDTSRYLFGSTVAPGHVPTTTWLVDLKSTTYNAFAFGIQFAL